MFGTGGASAEGFLSLTVRQADSQLLARARPPWQERQGEVLILVDGFEKQSNLSHSSCAPLDFVPARAIEVPKIVLII